MKVNKTRLRFVAAKDAATLISYFDNLAYKVELKEMVVKGGKFYQFFVLPDSVQDKSQAGFGDLD